MFGSREDSDQLHTLHAHTLASALGPSTNETLTVVRARESLYSIHSGHPPQKANTPMAGNARQARSAIGARSLLRCSAAAAAAAATFHLLRMSSAKASAMIGRRSLPPRAREVKEPAPAAAFTSAPSKLSPSEVVGRPADASARKRFTAHAPAHRRRRRRRDVPHRIMQPATRDNSAASCE